MKSLSTWCGETIQKKVPWYFQKPNTKEAFHSAIWVVLLQKTSSPPPCTAAKKSHCNNENSLFTGYLRISSKLFPRTRTEKSHLKYSHVFILFYLIYYLFCLIHTDFSSICIITCLPTAAQLELNKTDISKLSLWRFKLLHLMQKHTILHPLCKIVNHFPIPGKLFQQTDSVTFSLDI